MRGQTRRSIVAGALALSLIGAVWGGGTDPFARPLPTPVAAPQPVLPLDQAELTGATSLDGLTRVCIQDSATRRTRWLTVGEAAQDMAALEFNAESCTVLIQVGGARRWIGLRAAQIAELTLPRLEGGAIDWDHLRMSEAQKEREAEAMMTDMMEISLLARTGRLGRAGVGGTGSP